MGVLQNDDPPAPDKSKKTNKPPSKVIELLDQPDATPGNPPADKLVDDNMDNEPPIAGHQPGVRNYLHAELTLLNSCMAATVPVGPHSVSDAINLYNHVVKDKGWAERCEKPLQ